MQFRFCLSLFLPRENPLLNKGLRLFLSIVAKVLQKVEKFVTFVCHASVIFLSLKYNERNSRGCVMHHLSDARWRITDSKACIPVFPVQRVMSVHRLW